MKTYFYKVSYRRNKLPCMTIFRNINNKPKHLNCGSCDWDISPEEAALKLLYDCGEISKKIYTEACMMAPSNISLTEFQYKNIRIFNLNLL